MHARRSYILVFALLVLAGEIAPALLAQAEENVDQDVTPIPSDSLPLAWFPDANGTMEREPQNAGDLELRDGETLRLALERVTVATEFPAAPWNYSLHVASVPSGTLLLQLAHEGATATTVVSETVALDPATCPDQVCAGQLPIPAPFLVEAGERLVFLVGYVAPEGAPAPPPQEPEPPAPPTPAKGSRTKNAQGPPQGAQDTNRGTVKVHDDRVARPETRNEPHVSCGFWVQGENLADDSGVVRFYHWPSTGRQEEVSAQGASPRWHDATRERAFAFVNGPYYLPAGHYRVEVESFDGHPGSTSHFAKTKTFWVDECGSAGLMVLRVGTTETSLTAAHRVAALPTPELPTLVLLAAGLGVVGLLGGSRRR